MENILFLQNTFSSRRCSHLIQPKQMIHADVEDSVGDEVPGKCKLIFSNVSEDYFLNWLEELSSQFVLLHFLFCIWKKLGNGYVCRICEE